MNMIQTHRGNERDGMTGSWAWRATIIFRLIAEGQVNWPRRHMTELCEMRGVRPYHQAGDNPLELTTIRPFLLLNLVLCLVPCICRV
jgi:hypothetical protein